MRVLAHAARRRRDAHEVEQLDRALLACALERPRWRRSTSPICLPTVKDGFSDVIGLGRRTRLLPTDAAQARRGRLQQVVASEEGAPGDHCGLGRSRTSDSMVTDLPQPDSPTMPSTSPSASVNESRSTAWTVPSSVSNRWRGPRRPAGVGHRVVRGSRMSRSPSPSRGTRARRRRSRAPYTASHGAER